MGAGNQQETARIDVYADLVSPENLPRSGELLHNYLTGIVDGEGCFCVAVKRLRTSRFGFTLDPVFHVTQHASNRVVLDLLQRAMGAGLVIRKHGQPDTMKLYVHRRSELLENVIPFLERHALLVKRDELRKFKEIVAALEAREHWLLDGFERLTRLAFSMNMGGKQRRYRLEDVLQRVREGSSETIRRTSEAIPVMI